MRVGIIGVNGYIGENLASFLLQKGVEIRGYDFGEGCSNKSIKYSRIDVTCPKDIKVIDFSCDVLFVLAGKNGTIAGFEDCNDFVLTNEIGLLNVLKEHVKQKSRAKIIYPSSRLVYKGNSSSIKEDFDLCPKTIYATNKIACEFYLSVFHNFYKVDYSVFRIGIPYGGKPNRMPNATIGLMMRDAQKSGEIKLFGGGHQRRTFTDIRYICSVFYEACTNKATDNQIFNVDGEELSLRDVAVFVSSLTGASIVDQPWPEDYELIETGDCCLSGEKLHSAIDIKYNYSILDWIQRKGGLL